MTTSDNVRELVWKDTVLIDAQGNRLAEVQGTTLVVGSSAIELEHSAGAMRWRFNGVASDGTQYSMALRGASVGKVSATCGGRTYRLDRVNPFSKSRRIVSATGATIAATGASGLTDVTVTLAGTLAVPLEDLAFMTWGLTLIDAPARRTRR